MKRHLIVVSHRRSGTHLTIDAITNNFARYAANPPMATLTLDHLSEHVPRKRTQLEGLVEVLGRQACVLKTHAHANLSDFFIGGERLREFISEIFGQAKVIYVHRDGRDVLVSLYHYMRSFEPAIQAMPFSQFIRMPNGFDGATCSGQLSRPAYWQMHVQSWLRQPDILRLSYADLVLDYAVTLRKLADFVEEPLESLVDVRRRALEVPGLLAECRQDQPGQNSPEPSYSSINFRAGRCGDWKSHFSDDDLRFFYDEAGPAQDALGYEPAPAEFDTPAAGLREAA